MHDKHEFLPLIWYEALFTELNQSIYWTFSSSEDVPLNIIQCLNCVILRARTNISACMSL